MKRLIPFLVLLLIVAATLRVDFFFTILYFLLAVFLLTRWWRGQMLAHLSLRRQFEGRSFFGGSIQVALEVENKGWLPVPWIELQDALPVHLVSPPFFRQVVSLGPREKRRLEYTVYARQRGYYEIGPLRLTSGGLLGMHPYLSGEHRPDHLIVYPEILPLPQLGLPTRSPLVALPARSPLFEDPSWITSVRDYQWGDSPRRIHWTASASAGRLLVKQYRASIARETLICLDMGQDAYLPDVRYTAPELAVVAAASLANHIVVRDRLPAGLLTVGLDPLAEQTTRFFLPPRSGRGHLMNLLDVLARVNLAPTPPLADLLRRESVNLAWGATVALITGRESDKLLDTLAYLRRAGFAVSLILIQPAGVSAAFDRRAAMLNVPVHRVWRKGDLKDGLGTES